MAVYNTSMFFFSFSMSEMEKCQHSCTKCTVDMCTESDLGGNVNIFRSNNISHCGERVYMNRRLILNCYWDIVVWMSRPNSIKFLFVGTDEEQRVQKKGGYMRRIDCSHFGCCCLHKETWISTQTNNMWSSHMSYKVHWGWQWNFLTFIVICYKYVISVWQICCLTLN
jgi:hypothetical protein